VIPRRNLAVRVGPDLREVPESPADVAAEAEELLASLTAEPPPPAEERIRAQLGHCYRLLGRLEEAERHLDRALELVAEGSPQAIAYGIRRATVYHWQGRYAECDATLRELERRCRTDPALAEYEDFCSQHLGKSLLEQGRRDEATRCLERALGLREVKQDPELLASTQAALAVARAPLTVAQTWDLLGERLQRGSDGGVNWSRRYFAKRWSALRLGLAGLQELVQTMVPGRGRCWVFSSDDDTAEDSPAAAGVRRAMRDRDQDRHHWLIARDGRWIMELHADGTFSFEHVDPRHTRMLKRLEAKQAEWMRERRDQPPPA
jgi:Tetratricopeptide repeat